MLKDCWKVPLTSRCTNLKEAKPGDGCGLYPADAPGERKARGSGHERGEFPGFRGSGRAGFAVCEPANQGKTFALAALTPQATAVVTVAGLQKLLPVAKTVEEASAGGS